MQFDQEQTENATKKPGIKHPFFRGSNNGESHRKNAAKKKARYLKNQATRATLYSEYQGENKSGKCDDWHSRIKALSMGTA